jgi:hypothetical protein
VPRERPCVSFWKRFRRARGKKREQLVEQLEAGSVKQLK